LFKYTQDNEVVIVLLEQAQRYNEWQRKKSALDFQNPLTMLSRDAVQAQLATHIHPFSQEGDWPGTAGLHQLGKEYVKHNTFSVIVSSMHEKVVKDYFRIST